MSWLSRTLGIRPPDHRIRTYEDRLVGMRDGVGLRTQRIAPRDPGPRPTLLMRTPYGIGWSLPLPIMPMLARLFASRGYNVILQDTRGRYQSEGEFYPFLSERADGLDTLEWVSKQPWFDGQLGMWGASYFGYTQWALSAEAPDFVKAFVPFITSTDFHGLFYPGGAFSLISALRWAAGNGERRGKRVAEKRILNAARTRPARSATRVVGKPVGFFEDWADHPELDEYWQEVNHTRAHRDNRVPVLSIAGTYDIFAGPQLRDYQAMRTTTSLELGAYAHGSYAISPRKLGWKNVGRLRFLASSLDFLDHHLQGRELMRDPVERYIIGQDRWQGEEAWPPPEAKRTRLFLRARGSLDRESPGAHEEPASYTYYPDDPVPSLGGSFLGPKCGPEDQRPLEGRADILRYETEPLSRPLHIAGDVRLVVHMESDAQATDLTAKLVHLPADPRRPAINLCDGIKRLEEVQPGAMRVEIDLWSLSVEIPSGDRLRLEVSSSNFPRYDAHPNISGNPSLATKVRPARQKIHHSADAASFLEIWTLA